MPDNTLTPAAWQALRLIYPEPDIITGAQAAFMAVDESHAITPNPLCVLTPRNHDQVLKTVAWALAYQIAMVPSGGRTGLSGGACAGNGEVVLSLVKMNRVIDFDTEAGLITVEAGVVLETLQTLVAAQGWFYPVDYASRGSAQMGGAVATNAGGIRVLRYGMTRHWVAGIKAVTGAGQVVSIQRHLEKDNAGYDIKNLLAGSEGTLAVITEITFHLTRPMPEQSTLLAGIHDLSTLLSLFSALHKNLDLNAAEFFCANSMRHVMHAHQLPSPFSRDYAFYLLIECDKNEDSLGQAARILEGYDVVLAHSHLQAHELWRYRELISSTINPLQPYKNDIACSFSRMQDWFSALENGLMQINAEVEFVWFGHLGDGNVHVNIIRPSTMSEALFNGLIVQFSRHITAITQRFMATASAEHGIGLLKKEQFFASRSNEEIAINLGIKHIFDPQGILNPGKMPGF